jgi:hypothetical protein
MKVLVAGDVAGHFDVLFERVAAVHTSAGPFECLFCVGDFFDSNSKHGAATAKALEYLTGTIPVPIPTYFIVGKGSEFELPEEGGDIVTNLHFLGKGGVRAISGLHVAWVSGRFDAFVQSAGVSTVTAYTPRILKSVCTEAGAAEFGRKIDILLTAEWPKHLFATLPQEVAYTGGSKEIAQLTKFLQPRYHFAGTEGFYFVLPPYRNCEATHVTRFFGVAGVSSSSDPHRKWLYAMSIVPFTQASSDLLAKIPEDTTDNPFSAESVQRQETEIRKRKAAADQTAEEAKRAKQDAPCWFCIDSVAEDSRHLVVSHGSFAYLTLARGGLVDHHLLIVPMQHFTGSHQFHTELQEEIGRYIDALTALFASQQQYLTMYERNIHINGTPCHTVLQVIPVSQRIPEAAVKAELLQRATATGVTLDPYRDGDKLGEQFFLFALPGEKFIYRHRSKGKGKGKGDKFNLQFGRDVLASVLGCPKRIDWKACVKPIGEEKKLAQEFESDFRTYDWTKQADG